MCDAQAAHEKTLTGLSVALAGANLIYGAGMLEAGMSLNFGSLIMDNEIISLIKRFVRGVEVSDETLATEEIQAIGPDGDFFGTDHTFRHMKDETAPKLVDRRVRDAWEADGQTDMYQRALQEARRLAVEHEPLPPDKEVLRQMRAIVAEAEASLGVHR